MPMTNFAQRFLAGLHLFDSASRDRILFSQTLLRETDGFARHPPSMSQFMYELAITVAFNPSKSVIDMSDDQWCLTI
jgi:hypothetical protein